MKLSWRWVRKAVVLVTLAAFLLTSAVPGYAQGAPAMPAPGTRTALSAAFEPPVLRGVKVYANEPMRFDFILDEGSRAGRLPNEEANSNAEGRSNAETQNIASLRAAGGNAETQDLAPLRNDPARLIKYFMAAMTVPENDLWVNLSPYEKDRIVPEAFGQTEMGRDLLAQDYLLKQITASVIYPEGETGKKFWAEVYKKAQEKYGTTDIPMETFNKVWIVPEKAVVYERQPARSEGSQDPAISRPSGPRNDVAVAYINEARLKVMLETDYLATQAGGGEVLEGARHAVPVQTEILRTIVIPLLEKEVNEGANFAPLRQVYYSLILAAWYKKKIKDSLLAKAYVDRNKITGVNISDPKEAEKIWGQYVEAFKKGAFNYIKEEQDAFSGKVLPRKYFSGGMNYAQLISKDLQVMSDLSQVKVAGDHHFSIVPVYLSPGPRTGAFSAAQAPEVVARLKDGREIRELGLMSPEELAAVLGRTDAIAAAAAENNKVYWGESGVWRQWLQEGARVWVLQGQDRNAAGLLAFFPGSEEDPYVIASLVARTPGNGDGPVLLDTFFAEMQRGGVRQVTWLSSPGVVKFYKDYLSGNAEKGLSARVGAGVIHSATIPDGDSENIGNNMFTVVLSQAPSAAQKSSSGVNASRLEQVAGFIARIDAVFERSGRPVHVYSPGDKNNPRDLFRALAAGQAVRIDPPAPMAVTGLAVLLHGFRELMDNFFDDHISSWGTVKVDRVEQAFRTSVGRHVADNVHELLKNAFVHGNQLGEHWPVYLYLDPVTGRINVVDLTNREKASAALMKSAGKAGLHGKKMGRDPFGSELPMGLYIPPRVTSNLAPLLGLQEPGSPLAQIATLNIAGGFQIKQDPAQKADTGGIDLTAGRMDVETRGEGAGLAVNLDPAQIQAIIAAPGLTPVIMGVERLNDLRQFLAGAQ